jgi:hypothetical protein
MAGFAALSSVFRVADFPQKLRHTSMSACLIMIFIGAFRIRGTEVPRIFSPDPVTPVISFRSPMLSFCFCSQTNSCEITNPFIAGDLQAMNIYVTGKMRQRGLPVPLTPGDKAGSCQKERGQKSI